MGFFDVLFPGAEAPKPPPAGDATRWERAVSAVNGIAKQVAKIDADGVDVLCFPGPDGSEFDKYGEVTSVKAIKGMVTAQEPGGPCLLVPALNQALSDAFERGFDEKPCSMIVFLAGLPEDKDGVFEKLHEFCAGDGAENITITFVQVGNDPDLHDFLQGLDDDGDVGEMVDTCKDEDIKSSMTELQDPSFMESGGTGGLLGAFAGMAIGAGGYYMYSKMQAKKRTEGWSGTWEVVMPPGNEPTGVQLNVTDNGEGGLAIEGYPMDDSAGLPSTEGSYEDTDDGYTISRISPDGEYIGGTVIDEHQIEWQDDSVWREVPPEGVDWMKMAAAGAAGAAAGGAVGLLVQKKFFNKANNGEPANYMIVVDRSDAMTAAD